MSKRKAGSWDSVCYNHDILFYNHDISRSTRARLSTVFITAAISDDLQRRDLRAAFIITTVRYNHHIS